MPSAAVVGFLPSRHGFRFANRWPSGPARTLTLGPLRLPIGDTGRGLCGGMIFTARDRFERGEEAPPDSSPPAAGSVLFDEIVDRQFASFGTLFTVPIRFWLAAAQGDRRRDRETALAAWPATRAELDAGRLAMVGLIRLATRNPLAPLGHQVVAFRYEETQDRVAIGVYDPNHPGNDAVEAVIERAADGSLRLSYSTGEPLIGLLALPYAPPSG